MKKISFLPVLLILFTISCRKSNSPTNKLPPETHDGDNTMGCYVNNQLFIPQEPALNNNSFSSASIQRVPSFNLYLSWEDNSNSTASGLILIELDSIQLVQGATYTLGAPPDSLYPNGHAQWATYVSDAFYKTAGQGTGQVTIDYYDSAVSGVSGIVAGHFSFSAFDVFGDTVQITEGRFDMTTYMP